ncbi:MAG: hypothetical protein NC127_04915 [Muribaculum sp.]|nr:hypothetical protein [Muribaculum sp.]
MKKNVMMMLLAVLAAMMCWSCKDDKEEEMLNNGSQDGPVLVDGKVVFGKGGFDSPGPDVVGIGVPYEPVDFDDLPEFVKDELVVPKRDKIHIMDFVYEGTWKGNHAYVVYTDELLLSSLLVVGHLYLADGTYEGVPRLDEFWDNVDMENDWKCIFYWRPLYFLPDDFDEDKIQEYLMSLELYRRLMGFE